MEFVFSKAAKKAAKRFQSAKRLNALRPAPGWARHHDHTYSSAFDLPLCTGQIALFHMSCIQIDSEIFMDLMNHLREKSKKMIFKF